MPIRQVKKISAKFEDLKFAGDFREYSFSGMEIKTRLQRTEKWIKADVDCPENESILFQNFPENILDDHKQ